MTTLADKAILSGADNRPPMLEKNMYDSWKSRMELYMLNRQHGRMILESVENGPLIWPSIEENGVTRPKRYSELSPTEAIQADCDIKATNIILQGLPPEVYALVSNHKVAKELWERIQLLMQGTSLTKQERECKLYDEFDKFAYKKGETLRDFYLRFSLLLNDMNIYNMKLEQFQVNTKFLNTLPPEWSKFVTDVKLVRDLHTTNVDQLHAYLGQHEFHANEVRLMHERNSDPLALVATHQMTQSPYQTHQNSYQNTQFQQQVSPYQSPQYGSPYQSQQYSNVQLSTPLSITYPSNDYQSSVHHNVYSPSSSIPQLEYKGDDPIDAINHMMSFLTAVVTSRYPTTNNQLRNLSNPRQQATINDGRITLQPVQGRQIRQTSLSRVQRKTYTPRSNALVEVSVQNQTLLHKQDSFVKNKEQVKVLKEGQNVDLKSNDTVSDSSAQSVEIDHLKQTLSEHLKEKESLMQTVTLLKNNFKKEESRNIDREIVITSAIVIPDSKETLLLAEESRSKMLLKQKDPMMLEKKVNTTPVDYANSMNSPESTLSSRPTIVEVPKELPKVSMVNTSLNKLKHHLAGFDMVVKERTMPTAITEGSWGFEHTKACFRDEIIPFAVEQYHLESKTFEVKMNQVLNENERLLEQVINKDIVNIIVNSSMDNSYMNAHECEKCLKLETELLNKKDFVKKEIYDKLFKSFTTLEKHCIPLEFDTQLNQEIFQRDNSVSNLSAPSFDQLKINEDKIKKDLEEIETINIELDHMVSKLIAENEHLKQTYKQLYDSIKPTRIRSKVQCEDLINQVNLKSVEISDLNPSLQEGVLVITTLKDDLRKLKGKALDVNDVTKHPSDPEMLKIDVEPITPKLLNKMTAHSAYIKHTQEEATVLRDLVDHIKSNYPLDHTLDSACRYTKLIQELLTNISKTCPSINNTDGKLVVVTLKNKDKRVRFTKPVIISGHTITKIASTSNLVSNKPMLSSTGVKPSTSDSGSQPSGNTKKDKIQQTSSSTQKNKVEAHSRNVKSSLKNKDCVVAPKGTANVQHSKLNANSELKCVKCNGCMLFDNHDLYVLDFINNLNARVKSKSRPTGRTFTIVGNACPLTRITTTTEVPFRKPTALEHETPKPVITLVYSRKPIKFKTNVPVSKSKVVQIALWYLDSGCSKHMTGDRSQLSNLVNKFLGTIKFRNDHVAKILGYGDYQIGNVTISRVYYVEGLGHNLFSVGQFCYLNLEVAFRQHTCFIRNLEGVDLLT
ncbi:hypothetical protein Tco_0855208 [Tanacetum coccineum]